MYSFEEEFNFYAGSYSSYNVWREYLAQLAGYEPTYYIEFGQRHKSYTATVWNDPKPRPFLELINFSDCEGTLGTQVSKKLLIDFEEYSKKVRYCLIDSIYAASPDYDWLNIFEGKYENFREAFTLAAQNGAVTFT